MLEQSVVTGSNIPSGLYNVCGQIRVLSRDRIHTQNLKMCVVPDPSVVTGQETHSESRMDGVTGKDLESKMYDVKSECCHGTEYSIRNLQCMVLDPIFVT